MPTGVPFSFEVSGGNMLSLMTTGTITTSVAWAIDIHGNVLVPPTTSNNNQLYKYINFIHFVIHWYII